jgi:hypothetical protein
MELHVLDRNLWIQGFHKVCDSWRTNDSVAPAGLVVVIPPVLAKPSRIECLETVDVIEDWIEH